MFMWIQIFNSILTYVLLIIFHLAHGPNGTAAGKQTKTAVKTDNGVAAGQKTTVGRFGRR